ncbi:MAG: response regulator [Desulfovibrionaceae bacterium]
MGEKVLLIDDEAEFLSALSERMRLRGMDVTTASNAADALEAIKNDTFDAIFLDLQMPGTDGIESLRKIRDINPDLQVILLTGHATVDKGIEAMKLGAMDFMEKPADVEQLREKVRKAHARKMLLVERRTESKISEILAERGW